MNITKLSIPGSWLFEFEKFYDKRGFFFESYRSDSIEKELKRKFVIKQTNTSLSSRGSLRGIHYALTPPSQAKFIQCQRGSIQDFIIDIRLGSPNFGEYQMVELDENSAKAIFIEEGLAHAFVAMEDNTLVTYYVNQTYNPQKEKGINPLDKTLNVYWPEIPLKMSQKDEKEIDLVTAEKLNLLPLYEETLNFIRNLD